MTKYLLSAENSLCIGLLFFLFIGCAPSSPEKKVSPPSVMKDSSANTTHDRLTAKYYNTLSERELDKTEIKELKSKIDSVCRLYLDNDSILEIAVEFIDLRSEAGFTLFPKKRFIPASLLKIPILIAAYKLEEEKPGSMTTILPVYEVINEDIDINLDENETYSYQSNKQYTLNELVKIMISHSDNRATLSVLEFLDKQSPGIVERVEKDLNASIPTGVDNKTEIIHIGHFADMLKAIYSCSYLTESHSNSALQILCSSQYQRGFRKSIPTEIGIACKFGVRFNVSPLNPEFSVQLHEVGLIYHPTNPFILSVMTKGAHIEPLRRALREIALICYDEIDHLSIKHEKP